MSKKRQSSRSEIKEDLFGEVSPCQSYEFGQNDIRPAAKLERDMKAKENEHHHAKRGSTQ